MSLPPILANLPLPIIGSPLFIISNPKLVIEQCKAGIVGSMPALNARPAEQLDEWLAEITETLAHDRANRTSRRRRFAINQIVHQDATTAWEHDMAVCAKYKVPIVITLAGRDEPTSTTRCTAGAASCCTTSSTTCSRTRRSKRAPMV